MMNNVKLCVLNISAAGVLKHALYHAEHRRSLKYCYLTISFLKLL